MNNAKTWNPSWAPLSALVPLVGVGWMEPWWMCWLYVLLGVLFVRSRWEHLHLHVSLPVVLALLPAALLYPDPLRMSAVFLGIALSGVLLVRATQAILNGSLPALIALAVVWAAFPSVPGLLGLYCAALARSEQSELHVRNPGIVVLLGGVMVVLLFLVPLLPPPPTQALIQQLNIRIMQPEEVLFSPEQQLDQLMRPGQRQGGPASSPPPVSGVDPAAATSAFSATNQFLLFCLMLVFAVGLLLLRERIRSQHPRLSDLVMLLAVFSTLTAVVVYSQLHIRQGATSGNPPPPLESPENTPVPPPQTETTPAQNPSLPAKTNEPASDTPWWPYLLPAGLAVWMFWRTISGRTSRAQASFTPEVTPGSSSVTLHGVRKLYRDFLNLMQQQGVVRTASHTPDEFAAQVGHTHPQLQVWVEVITAAYLPMRYGNLPDQDTFEAAELALEHLNTAFSKGQK